MESHFGVKVMYDLSLSCTASIRLDWKWMTLTNTLAYCGIELITAVKSYIVQAGEDFGQFFNLWPVQ